MHNVLFYIVPVLLNLHLHHLFIHQMLMSIQMLLLLLLMPVPRRNSNRNAPPLSILHTHTRMTASPFFLPTRTPPPLIPNTIYSYHPDPKQGKRLLLLLLLLVLLLVLFHHLRKPKSACMDTSARIKSVNSYILITLKPSLKNSVLTWTRIRIRTRAFHQWKRNNISNGCIQHKRSIPRRNANMAKPVKTKSACFYILQH
mmetsp:Transcript_15136/g.22653  ORF Transcript_15136/g.22653 Transcript_15136/m.22653 type:complete len:200 (+) Transcript_15136:210-809(+)